jgi:hypothetical protein
LICRSGSLRLQRAHYLGLDPLVGAPDPPRRALRACYPGFRSMLEAPVSSPTVSRDRLLGRLGRLRLAAGGLLLPLRQDDPRPDTS